MKHCACGAKATWRIKVWLGDNETTTFACKEHLAVPVPTIGPESARWGRWEILALDFTPLEA